jgi:hypothetical protein
MSPQEHGEMICETCGHPRRFHWLNTEQGERLGVFSEACAATACGCVFFKPREGE